MYMTAKMKAQEEQREKELMDRRDETPELTAKDLSQGLSGTINQRIEEDRSIVLTMRHGERPDVIFTGFWNGRLVKNAMNAISRSYRLRRHKEIRAHADVPNQGEGDGR
jgi:hypothetical protein